MAISPQRLTVYLYSAHRAVIFAIAQLSCFGDMFDRMPKIVGVTWPRPRPLSGKIIFELAWHSRNKAAYQIWSVYSSSSFRDIAL